MLHCLAVGLYLQRCFLYNCSSHYKAQTHLQAKATKHSLSRSPSPSLSLSLSLSLANTMIYNSITCSAFPTHTHPPTELEPVSVCVVQEKGTRERVREKEREWLSRGWWLSWNRAGESSSNLGFGFRHHRKSIQQPEGEINVWKFSWGIFQRR